MHCTFDPHLETPLEKALWSLNKTSLSVFCHEIQIMKPKKSLAMHEFEWNLPPLKLSLKDKKHSLENVHQTSKVVYDTLGDVHQTPFVGKELSSILVEDKDTFQNPTLCCKAQVHVEAHTQSLVASTHQHPSLLWCHFNHWKIFSAPHLDPLFLWPLLDPPYFLPCSQPPIQPR